MKRLHTFLLILLTVLLCACSGDSPSDRPVLTVTIEPVRYVVEAIAGNRYAVETLMPKGASPETYEPTPRQMMQLQRSAALFQVGTLGFEQTRLPEMVESMPTLPVISLGDSIKPIVDPHHSHEGHTSSIDPHVWMSPLNLIQMARNAHRTLCRLDSVHIDYYTHRLDSFEIAMNALHLELKSRLTPLAERSFLIYHPALGYYARDYGLQQLTVEHDGKEPTAASLRALINQCRGEEVKAIFISAEHSGQGARRVAEALGRPTLSINPLDTDVPAQLRMITKMMLRK